MLSRKPASVIKQRALLNYLLFILVCLKCHFLFYMKINYDYIAVLLVVS